MKKQYQEPSFAYYAYEDDSTLASTPKSSKEEWFPGVW